MSDSDEPTSTADGEVTVRTSYGPFQERIWAEDVVRLELNIPHLQANLLLKEADINVVANNEDGRITLNVDADRSASVSFEAWQRGEWPEDE